MSLAFLAKKSWNTTNLKNVEKVWLAEQKQTEEEKKLEEFKKQIEDERQIEELKKLQENAGLRESSKKIGWMYEGPAAAAQQEQDAEAYLLGKEYVAKKPSENQGLIGTFSVGYEKNTQPFVPTRDGFSRQAEDPMMAIRMKEKDIRKQVISNPVKMAKMKKQIQESLGLSGISDESIMRESKSKMKKKLKKEKRKDKKKKKKKKSKHDEDVSEASEEGGKKGEKDETKFLPLQVQQSKKRYGLIGDSASADKKDIGPAAAFLRSAENRKRKEEERVQELLSRKRYKSSLTESEKERLRQEFEVQADHHEVSKAQRLKKNLAEKVKEESEGKEEKRSASFLRDMNQEVYNSNTASMSDRLERNRHYHQRDLSSESFMRR